MSMTLLAFLRGNSDYVTSDLEIIWFHVTETHSNQHMLKSEIQWNDMRLSLGDQGQEEEPGRPGTRKWSTLRNQHLLCGLVVAHLCFSAYWHHFSLQTGFSCLLEPWPYIIPQFQGSQPTHPSSRAHFQISESDPNMSDLTRDWLPLFTLGSNQLTRNSFE